MRISFRLVTAGLLLAGSLGTVTPARSAPARAGDHRATVAGTRALLQQFVHAYNQRDLTGVLRTFSKDFLYGDCDYAQHRWVVIRGNRSRLSRWLRGRFSLHDRFEYPQVFVPATHPRDGSIGVHRVNPPLEELQMSHRLPLHEGFKAILTADGTKLAQVALSSAIFCAAGTLPKEARPDQERALAQAFLDAYDRGDVSGVLATFGASITYDDCNGVPGICRPLTDVPSVVEWIRARFNDHDQFQATSLLFDSWFSQPTNNPMTVVAVVGRTSDSHPAGSSTSATYLIIIVPDSSGQRIASVSVQLSPGVEGPSL
ncbi:MAG TPA: hypothetical protein VF221_15260 [Chloroflexota bacterium]